MKIGGAYLQFSKLAVIFVLLTVTAMAASGLISMMRDGVYSEFPSLFRSYTEFASVVFVAYSGNSAAEKWLLNRKGHEEDTAQG